MNSCLSGRDVWLLDCMNIRGACNFPELSLFCEAIRRWAASLETARRLPPLVVLAIDHGLRQEAFALSATLAVAFSGDADADTLIVSAVDALLSADPHELRVVTSDHLLRQRCRRELPLDASEAYLGGVQRPLEQLVTLAFESSETFARTLTLTPAAVPSADSVFSAYGGEAPEAPEGGSGAAVEAPMPLTKRARRKAQRRAETQCARARCYSETTAERVRAAESLHRRAARATPTSKRVTIRTSGKSVRSRSGTSILTKSRKQQEYQTQLLSTLTSGPLAFNIVAFNIVAALLIASADPTTLSSLD
ncbi:hypothetical protein Ctob_008084 [Chrysochromulina tobinii]|uniref:NYN domain-containing protein n=1 Tax=Chrysochromulina tobinii TaxID=1460289 RepID=A0A0M0JNE3_9EUKA|nr:hypothetical protein Ctob_008084 [Chrysochromulina tobinii]|eukprot:KOO28101.1 hypothetical protein Ctob_008084 [Chrysochromulina sp. CCMP291]